MLVMNSNNIIKLMMQEALYYAFYYVMACYTQATNQDPVFI